MVKHNKQKLLLIYLLFFIVAISMYDARYMSLLEKNIAGFTLIFLIVYTLTLNLNKSFRVSLCGIVFLSIFDLLFRKKQKENFDENDVDDDTKDYATESNTRDFNSLNKKLDLDKLLKKDNTEQEEENRKVNSSKTLEELEELLNKAKKEGALKTGKKISEYSPAEAQKATYQLINTTDQLKQTVEGLLPAIENGKKLLDMMEKFK